MSTRRSAGPTTVIGVCARAPVGMIQSAAMHKSREQRPRHRGLEVEVIIVFMVSAANMAGTACVIFMGKFSFRRLKALTHWRHALRRGFPPPGPSPNISYIV